MNQSVEMSEEHDDVSFKIYLNGKNFGPEIRRFVVDGDISLLVLRQILVNLFTDRLKGKEFKLRSQFVQPQLMMINVKKLHNFNLVVCKA